MELRGGPEHTARLYIGNGHVEGATKGDGDGDNPCSYVLCMQGLCAWSTTRQCGLRERVQVLSREVVERLQGLLIPWWSERAVVDADISKRQEEEERPRVPRVAGAELMRVATTPLAKALLLNGCADPVTQCTDIRWYCLHDTFFCVLMY